MAGLVGSIFGKTVQELQQERIVQRKKQMAEVVRQAQQQRGSTGAASLGFVLGQKLGRKMFGDPEMEKAREAEEQQAALNKQLGSIDRADDPRRFMILADAAREVGDKTAYTKYIQLAAQYEELGERRRQKYRDEEQKQADELAEALDMRDKGAALSTIFDTDVSEEERNKALQDFYQVGGTANDLYAYKQLGESLSKGGITKRQASITDKFVSDLSNTVVSPAEVYENYKSIYGDDFVVPKSFLDRFNTNNIEQPNDNSTVSGKGLNLTEDNSNKNNKTPEANSNKNNKTPEANLGTLYDVLGLPTEETWTEAFRPWELK